jgi:hypothetical protein
MVLTTALPPCTELRTTPEDIRDSSVLMKPVFMPKHVRKRRSSLAPAKLACSLASNNQNNQTADDRGLSLPAIKPPTPVPSILEIMHRQGRRLSGASLQILRIAELPETDTCERDEDQTTSKDKWDVAKERRESLVSERQTKLEQKSELKVKVARQRRDSIVEDKMQTVKMVSEMRRQRVREKGSRELRKCQERMAAKLILLCAWSQRLVSRLVAYRHTVNAAKTIQGEWRLKNPRRRRLDIAIRAIFPLRERLFKGLRAQRRCQAANQLCSFLKAFYGQKRFVPVVSKLRWRVVTVQRSIRSFLACKKARLAALSLLWQQLEKDPEYASQIKNDTATKCCALFPSNSPVLDLTKTWEKEHFYKYKASQIKANQLLTKIKAVDNKLRSRKQSAQSKTTLYKASKSKELLENFLRSRRMEHVRTATALEVQMKLRVEAARAGGGQRYSLDDVRIMVRRSSTKANMDTMIRKRADEHEQAVQLTYKCPSFLVYSTLEPDSIVDLITESMAHLRAERRAKAQRVQFLSEPETECGLSEQASCDTDGQEFPFLTSTPSAYA